MEKRSRIRVFQVLECGGPGGTGNQVAALCRELDPERFETTLVYAVRPGASKFDFESFARGAVEYVHIPEMVREISPINDILAFRKLYRLFAEEAPDIVHAHSSKAGVLARIAARAAGVPRILYSPRGYAFLQRDRNWLSRFSYWFIEALISPVSEIVACSPSEGKTAMRMPLKRGVSIVCDAYLGNPKSRARPESDSRGDRIVAAIGRIAYARDPETFGSLSAAILKQRDRVRFQWIGDGELRNSMDPSVEVTGWVEPDDAIRKLSKCSLVVHHSLWDALSNAILEAMALGIPVIASDIPGNRDAVEDGVTGYLVTDEMQLIERVLRLLDDPGLRARLGEAGRKRFEDEFTLERMMKEISALYAGNGED
ncbi:MAG: hypothetical protein COB53_02575 [Elusimicrobia bacterium]|nr:MAG: hypothetical protein COB53_02575 [Elusimicrobiota bacterium]